MRFKKVGLEHFQTFIKARDAAPEDAPIQVKSYGYRVQRLYYCLHGERIAYVQRSRDGETSYHIGLAS